MGRTFVRGLAAVVAAAVFLSVGQGIGRWSNHAVTRGGVWSVDVVGADSPGTIYALYWRSSGIDSVGTAVDVLRQGTHLAPTALEHPDEALPGTAAGALPRSDSQSASAARAWVAAHRYLDLPIDTETIPVVSGDIAVGGHRYASYAGRRTYSPGDGTIRIGTMDSPVAVEALDDLPIERLVVSDRARPALTVPSGITGPSAGVAYFLRYVEHLTGRAVAPGHVIAATGTISVNGFLGHVGGVAEKVRAAVASGADILVVPASNESEARTALTADDPDGTVALIAVNTVDALFDSLCFVSGSGASWPCVLSTR